MEPPPDSATRDRTRKPGWRNGSRGIRRGNYTTKAAARRRRIPQRPPPGGATTCHDKPPTQLARRHSATGSPRAHLFARWGDPQSSGLSSSSFTSSFWGHTFSEGLKDPLTHTYSFLPTTAQNQTISQRSLWWTRINAKRRWPHWLQLAQLRKSSSSRKPTT